MEAVSRLNFLRAAAVSGAAMMMPGFLKGRSVDTPFNTVPAKPLRVAYLTDIHIQDTPQAKQGFTSCLQALNSMKEKPDFIINGGDAIMNAADGLSKEKLKGQWKFFHSLLNDNNSLPVYHSIGNHDLFGWQLPDRTQQHAKLWVMEEYKMQSRYYSFEKDNWKFIVLDSIHGRDSIPGYYGKLDDEQMQWLVNELKQTAASKYICIVSHIPILAVCSMFDGNNKSKAHWNIPDNSIHADASELTALFYQYPNIKTCFSGHIHLIDHVNYLGIDYYCNGAVCGSWWKGNYKQFPPAFVMMNFHPGGKVEREVHYYDWQGCPS